MNVSSAAPLTSEQYCHTPTCLLVSVSPAPPIDQWVRATCWPLGKALPSFEVHGTALNLSRRFVVPCSLDAMPRSSDIFALLSAMVWSYQRIVKPCSRLCTSSPSSGRSEVV